MGLLSLPRLVLERLGLWIPRRGSRFFPRLVCLIKLIQGPGGREWEIRGSGAVSATSWEPAQLTDRIGVFHCTVENVN